MWKSYILDKNQIGEIAPLKLIYSEKATKFCEISTLLFYVLQVKSKVEILQNFVPFSEYMSLKGAISPIWFLSRI